MKKPNDAAILIIGIIIFAISYSIDNQASAFFKEAKFPLFDAVFSTITNFGVVLIVMLAIPSIMIYKKKRKLAYLLLAAFFISFALAFVLKLAFLRQRPIDAFTYPFTGIINYSFPSMHAMVVFALLPILAKYLQKQRTFWLSFAFLAVFSRIYLGFHFLSDVVFGALSGYFIGTCLLRYSENKKWLK
ncbi:phosphatase PAP2 family protein [Candidatus Woesearchaeota archaeon]|nr:phosphatase PAP2 family protein [Candidatus Woesearchaeota archaeon]